MGSIEQRAAAAEAAAAAAALSTARWRERFEASEEQLAEARSFQEQQMPAILEQMETERQRTEQVRKMLLQLLLLVQLLWLLLMLLLWLLLIPLPLLVLTSLLHTQSLGEELKKAEKKAKKATEDKLNAQDALDRLTRDFADDVQRKASPVAGAPSTPRTPQSKSASTPGGGLDAAAVARLLLSPQTKRSGAREFECAIVGMSGADEIREAFNAFDTDGSGGIDREEFGEVCKELGRELTPEKLQVRTMLLLLPLLLLLLLLSN